MLYFSRFPVCGIVPVPVMWDATSKSLVNLLLHYLTIPTQITPIHEFGMATKDGNIFRPR